METQVNVVFMGNIVYPRGMADAKRIQYFIDYLSSEGVGASVLLLRQGGVHVSSHSAEGTYKGVHYKTIGHDIGLNCRLFLTLGKYFVEGMGTLRASRVKNKKNILYCYGGLTLENIAFVLAAKKLGYVILLDIVEDNTHIQEKMHFLGKVKWLAGEFLESRISGIADGVIVISRYLKSLYQKQLKTTVPICLLPISATCDGVVKKTRRDGEIKIVYSGSFAKKDGLELLIEAFEKIHKDFGNCTLMLTGMGANLPQYQTRIVSCPAIRYIGYLQDSEFRDFLQQADVLCITRTGSIYANAGFPFKLGEYLATGNPVIVSDVGDVTHYLENMKDAIIVEADSVTAIEKALEYCIRNPEEASKIGRNGQLKCKEHFNPSLNGRKLLELMHEL